MSRLEERLERDLDAIAGQAAPGPDAWRSIQARLVEAEVDPSVGADGNVVAMLSTPISESYDHSGERPRRGVWLLPVAAAAALCLVVLIGVRSDGDQHERDLAQAVQDTVSFDSGRVTWDIDVRSDVADLPDGYTLGGSGQIAATIDGDDHNIDILGRVLVVDATLNGIAVGNDEDPAPFRWRVVDGRTFFTRGDLWVDIPPEQGSFRFDGLDDLESASGLPDLLDQFLDVDRARQDGERVVYSASIDDSTIALVAGADSGNALSLFPAEGLDYDVEIVVDRGVVVEYTIGAIGESDSGPVDLRYRVTLDGLGERQNLVAPDVSGLPWESYLFAAMLGNDEPTVREVCSLFTGGPDDMTDDERDDVIEASKEACYATQGRVKRELPAAPADATDDERAEWNRCRSSADIYNVAYEGDLALRDMAQCLRDRGVPVPPGISDDTIDDPAGGD